MKKTSLLFLLILSLFFNGATAQNSPSHLRVSLLTCGSFDELYSTWGHTALRITDSVKQTDIVYNYGTFDFNDPDFYTKFTRGKLDYLLSISSLPDFMYEYQTQGRDVTEQVLFLSDNQKTAVQKAVNDNLIGAARYYKYDFLYNNCTTRVRDILIKYAGLRAEKILVPAKTTFRNMLHQYLDQNAEPWSKLGIDLLLGSPIDKVVNITQSMFLPDYLMHGVDSSTQANQPNLVQQKTLLNKGNRSEAKNDNWPLYLFSAFAIIIMGISFLQNKSAKKINKVMDVLLFLLTGLLGCFLVFMWFGTDHKACAANYNLLWALPTNLIAAFFIWKNQGRLQKYFTITAAVYATILVCWFWLPQQLNIALIPIVVLLLQRCWQLRKPIA